jgi:hypothetical protein
LPRRVGTGREGGMTDDARQADEQVESEETRHEKKSRAAFD